AEDGASSNTAAVTANDVEYKLEVVVADKTAYTVVVMFNDTATELLKCSAESLMRTKDENSDAEDKLNLPVAIRNLIGIDHKTIPNSSAEDDASSNTAAVTANDVESPMKILEVVVADKTAYTVVVMFNDTATELLKCSAESLMRTKDENSDAEDKLNLPVAIRNLIGIDHKTIPNSSAEDGASSNTAAVTANDVESPMKIVTK
ncbi:DNA helicase PIF1, ATP-dependent, partial [Tanacetum coccineum]